MIAFKEGVRLNLLSPAIQHLLVTLARLAALDKRIYVVTSGNDSGHMMGSRHFTDEAIDVRTHMLTTTFKRTLRLRYEDALGAAYRVLLEDEGKPNEHLHAQVRRHDGLLPPTDGT